MKKLTIAAFFYGILVLLGYSVFIDSPQLLRISVVGAWSVILLLLAISLVTIGHNCNLVDVFHPERHSAAREFLQLTTKRHGWLQRAANLVFFAAFTVLLAYSGWVFTAVCYIAANIALWLCISVARDTLAKLDELQA